MHARVFVTLKSDVLDPQGDAVQRALKSLGFSAVSSVRVGKVIDVELDDTTEAEAAVRAMCEKLLVNPVIEEAQVELSPNAK